MYIEIDGWRSNLRFSACHFIPEYPKAPRVHGYTYTINIRVHGSPNPSGIIIDFELLKTKVSAIVDRFDHKVIIPRTYLEKEDESNVYFNVNDKSYSIPSHEAVFIDALVPSAEELCRIFMDELMARFDVPDNVNMIELGLDESWGQGAWTLWKK